MENAMTIATKGLIGGGDIVVATKGFIYSKFAYWFGQLWREIKRLNSYITNILSIDSRIDYNLLADVPCAQTVS